MMLSITSLAVMLAVVHAFPSEHEHLQHIPVPGYHPKLQVLGQHVDLHEVPTKVIKITKTVAIKVPVPYPVKVPHSVPYPVPVNKPYPVPVPQIIKVPHPVPVPIHSGHQTASLGQGDVDAGQYQGQYSVEEQNHDISSNGIGGGYANQYDHGYGESQQIIMPAVYQEQEQHQAAPTSYHTQEIASYESGGAPATLSFSINHTPYVQQNSQELKAEASERVQNGGYQMLHNSRVYQMGSQGQQGQNYNYKNQGY